MDIATHRQGPHPALTPEIHERVSWVWLARRLVLRLTDVRGLRRLLRRDPRVVVGMNAALGAGAVHRSFRLLVRTARHRPAAGTYTLRGSGARLSLRHDLTDLWVLEETFNRGTYTPPARIERLLRATNGPPRIVDLGAHIGAVSLDLLQRFRKATLVACEPNAESRALLEANLAANGLAERTTIVPAAAGVADGTVQMTGTSVLSHVVRPGDEAPADMRVFEEFEAGPVVDVPVVDILPYLEGADLVKIDIEGGEWDILADPRFGAAGVRAIVLEYHRLGAPGDDSRGAAVDLLHRAGYEVGEPFNEVNGIGLVWACRAPMATS